MSLRVLILCLVGNLFANTAYSLPRQTHNILGISAGIGLGVFGIVSTFVGFLPKPLGDAGHWGPEWCGEDRTVCIDSCTDGCLNMQKLQCEPFSGICKGNRYCMLSIQSYRFVNSTEECSVNHCRGGAQCLSAGKVVVPWNLDYPSKHYLGNNWGFAPAVLGPIAFVAGLVITVAYACAYWTVLSDDEAIPFKLR